MQLRHASFCEALDGRDAEIMNVEEKPSGDPPAEEAASADHVAPSPSRPPPAKRQDSYKSAEPEKQKANQPGRRLNSFQGRTQGPNEDEARDAEFLDLCAKGNEHLAITMADATPSEEARRRPPTNIAADCCVSGTWPEIAPRCRMTPSPRGICVC